MADRTCTTEGCSRKHWAKGWCSTHYASAYHERAAPVACERCGASFRGRTDRQARYCSKRCSTAVASVAGVAGRIASSGARAEAKRLRLLPVVFVGERMAPPPLRPPPLRPQSSGRVWVAGNCAWCAEAFILVDQLTARYCSERCGKRAHKQRRGRFLIRPALRLSIYERDGWRCQLCLDPVDATLPTTDQWSATLDHIECQSWALVPDHSPSNLRLAHRWCNSVRGDETYYTTAVLTA